MSNLAKSTIIRQMAKKVLNS